MVEQKRRDIDQDEVDKAKMSFLVGVFDLSWRLASLFLMPVFIGYAIDLSKDTSKYVIVGTVTGLVLSVLFIIKLGVEASRK